MREVLAGLAKHAGRSIDVHGAVGAIVGPGGINLSGPENIPLCLYQINGTGLSSSSGVSSSGDDGSGSGSGSSSSSGVAAGPSAWQKGGLDPTSWPNGVYWTYGQRCWWWIDQDWPVAPADEEQELIFAPSFTGGPPSLNAGDLAWCYFDEELGAWCILGGVGGTSTTTEKVSWFQLDCDPTVTQDGVPLAYICAGIIGTDGVAQVRTGCFGNPPDPNQAPTLVQSSATAGKIVAGQTVWLQDETGSPPGASSPSPGQVLAVQGDWVTAEDTGTTVTNPMGVGGLAAGTFEVWRIVSRVNQETSYYGQFPNGVLLQPGSSTTWPFVAVNLDIGITVSAEQTKLLDAGQGIGPCSKVVCRYSPSTASWNIEGAVCIADPSC
jgi:hypothetical protein